MLPTASLYILQLRAESAQAVFVPASHAIFRPLLTDWLRSGSLNKSVFSKEDHSCEKIKRHIHLDTGAIQFSLPTYYKHILK